MLKIFFFFFFFFGWNNMILMMGLFFFLFMLMFESNMLNILFVNNMFEMDSISYILISLSIWVIIMSLLGSYYIKEKNLNKELFISINVILLFFLILTFLFSNFIFFYFMFECSILPVFLMIMGWGSQVERNQAGVYMFFYTFLGSLPLLIMILWNYNNLGSFYFFFDYNLMMNNFYYLFLLLAFLIKFPIYSAHYWLLKAHVEAPVSGSMILAGVLLKLGGYGLIRFLVLFENMNFLLMEMVLSLSMLGGFYVSVNCLSHMDMKLLVASSSVVHMSMCIAGIFLMKSFSFSGLMILMVGHGLCSSGLFYLVNLVYMRSGSRSMYLNKGLLNIMPILSLCWFLMLIMNISAPPCISLMGEIILISSLLNYDFFFFFIIFFISFFSAGYSIYMFSLSQHGFFLKKINMMSNIYILEYFTIFLHLIPLNILILLSLILY